MVSGSFSLRFSRFFSPFLHSTGSLSVFSLAGWCRQFHTGFLRSRATQDPNPIIILSGYGILTLYDWPSHAILPLNNYLYVGPTTPICIHTGLGFSAFARHYSRNHYCFLLLLLLRCFSSEGLRISTSRLHRDRFPYSDIWRLSVACTSPQLFAACHVLRRL
jgi:hypothetical protein